jgi:hypothetical protein
MKPTKKTRIVPLDSLKPAPENNDIYSAIALDNPNLQELAQSIKEHGVLEPLTISRDGYIISGHRRRMASYLAGLKEVPVQVDSLSRTENPEEFLKKLVGANSQRIKSMAELIHESAIKIDPKEAHRQIVNERIEKQKRNRENLSVIDPAVDGRRCKISEAKMPLVEAINRIWKISASTGHFQTGRFTTDYWDAKRP